MVSRYFVKLDGMKISCEIEIISKEMKKPTQQKERWQMTVDFRFNSKFTPELEIKDTVHSTAKSLFGLPASSVRVQRSGRLLTLRLCLGSVK